MKVLIVSASVGAGHMQAANALAVALTAERPGTEVIVEDFIDEESMLGALLKDSYFKLLSMAPSAYDTLYRYTDRRFEFGDFGNVMELAMLRTMRRLYLRYQPDLMVFTHPFPCAGAAFLKRYRMLSIPCTAVITDFVAHRLWLYEEIDYYFVADESMRADIERIGIGPQRIFANGIPIRPGFRQGPRQSLPIEERPLSLLLMGGGLGLGEVGETVNALRSVNIPLQIIVATGRNGALRRQLNKIKDLNRQSIKVYGYTDQIHTLMQAADVLITKPGGLTCSEALACGLPMILTSPLPGQEQDNARRLVEMGAAVWAQSPEDVVGLVVKMISSPDCLNRMRHVAEKAGKPDAAVYASLRIFEILDRAEWYQRAN